MAKYKPAQRNGLLVPVILEEQLQVGTFEWAVNYLVDHELDLSPIDQRYRNDETGASAYDPRMLLKVVLLGYSRGLISSRKIERACEQNILFMAMAAGAQPSYGQIAKFVRLLATDIEPLFAQLLQTCDRMGLIGKTMFAIDGVKLPCNASKERSGTHNELRHRARRLEASAAKLLELHQRQDIEGPTQDEGWCKQRVEQLRKEAQATKDFIARTPPRRNAKAQELKANVTDPDSAKMLTNKGAIQGYAAQAAVDQSSQIIVAADVLGSGAEQSMLIPMIQKASVFGHAQTLYTADAGYFSKPNIQALFDTQTAALVADNAMRQRDTRFAKAGRFRKSKLHDKRTTPAPSNKFTPQEFTFIDSTRAKCPEGKILTGLGTIYHTERGLPFRRYRADAKDCGACPSRERCLRDPSNVQARQVAQYLKKQPNLEDPSERMKRAIDSDRGRRLYSQRIGTVEPVFANLRHHKRMDRFTLRGKAKVGTQWHLYCLVHNVEKMAAHLR